MTGTGTKKPCSRGRTFNAARLRIEPVEGEPSTLAGFGRLSYSWVVAPQQSHLRLDNRSKVVGSKIKWGANFYPNSHHHFQTDGRPRNEYDLGNHTTLLLNPYVLETA